MGAQTGAKAEGDVLNMGGSDVWERHRPCGDDCIDASIGGEEGVGLPGWATVGV